LRNDQRRPLAGAGLAGNCCNERHCLFLEYLADFGGMVTALFPMIPAVILAASIFADSCATRHNEAPLVAAVPAT
jgi:hypothetical protein